MSAYKTTHLPPDEIDRLRFRAFATNKKADVDAYFKAASLYFQERRERAMNRADLCDPMQDERVKALVEAAKRVREDFEDMREAFDGLASGTSVTTWPEMDPCGPMDAWMEGERLLRAALRDMGVE
jgi:hypothetical protein